MAAPKPTLLFVHGAWHNAKCWDKLRQELEGSGYPTIAPALISMEQTPAVASHMEDVPIVCRELESLVDAGKDIVLVMHSYGGMVGGEAIAALEKTRPGIASGRIKAAIFLSAFLVPKGKSLIGMFDEGPPPYLEPHPDDPSFLIIKDPHETFYNDVTKEEADPWISSMRPQAGSVFASEVEGVAWEHVPCTYLFCEKDQGVYPSLQRMMLDVAKEGAKEPWKVLPVNSSHSVWLSNAPTVLKVIREAAGEKA